MFPVVSEDVIRAVESFNKDILSENNLIAGSDMLLTIKGDIEQKEYFKILKRVIRRFRKKQYSGILQGNNLDEEAWERSLSCGEADKRYVVYSCITGDYDTPSAPILYPNNIDYIIFLTKMNQVVNGWEKREIPKHIVDIGNNALINRYIKMHPFELFQGNYDYAIYIDGNIQPISDLSYYSKTMDKSIGMSMHAHSARNCIYDESQACIRSWKGNAEKLRRQANLYRKHGFPPQYGLLECNVMITDLHSKMAYEIYEQWWDELNASGSGRDQVALPYVLWKHDILISDVARMGKNVYKDTKLRLKRHRKT